VKVGTFGVESGGEVVGDGDWPESLDRMVFEKVRVRRQGLSGASADSDSSSGVLSDTLNPGLVFE